MVTNPTSSDIYCLACRSRTGTTGNRQVVLKNGSSAVSGQCTICGARKFRIGAAEQEPEQGGRIARFFSNLPRRKG